MGVAADTGRVELFERARELAAIDAVLRDADAGSGRVLVVEAAAGIGKTALIRAADAMARARAMRVLRARAGELESGFAFGVVRQMFEPVLAACGRSELLTGAAAHAAPVFLPGGAPVAPDMVVLHGLHWLTAQLAAAQPLALLVDDAHWVDPASARSLDYLARRIDGLPVALVVALRPEGAATELSPRARCGGARRRGRRAAAAHARWGRPVGERRDARRRAGVRRRVPCGDGGQCVLRTRFLRSARVESAWGRELLVRELGGPPVDMAHRCGARLVEDRCLSELRLAGARPRRPALTGLEALTEAERRVAQLAAQGRSNAQIAQSLFVTVKTVEGHLARAYRKLGVSGRAELGSALAA